ncbi:DUF937 domain-containing protein [Antarcticibacterium flavum]|uniref:DUF937 domain-containing protein n=1 Tax=Antarcticibacterium flavum TaxID=2058175 RepID=A0A5B7X931_9FLAO|nr:MULTISPECIES: DUF937 domain-containing protein [Antarcticibacterium]MCM4160329.1 hypothetical protein [Antarcticibacterium sp. W02-3]QCY71292.1 DUF937 domain-containing protein [Antarcticibacterium flavum]
MASILDLLNTQKGKELITKASERTGESKEKVTGVIGIALPLLLGAMKRNISSAEGKNSLNRALNEEKHGEEYLENLENIDPQEMTSEGGKILNHILGENQNNIISTVATTMGMKNSNAAEITKMLAPLLLSVLASQKRKEKVEEPGLENLISSVLGSSGKFDDSLIETLLDNKGDINIINDVKGMILGGGKTGKKDGGILGGMLGGK